MDPIRALLDVLIIVTTLSVIIGLLFSKRRNPAQNPLVLIIMVFLTVLIMWLAYLGAINLLKGCNPVVIPPQTLIVVILFTGIVSLSFFKPRTNSNPIHTLILILGSLWVLLISILSVIGLNSITADYAAKHSGTWAILSLSITLAIQIILVFQRYKKKGDRNAKGLDLRREDHPGRENRV